MTTEQVGQLFQDFVQVERLEQPGSMVARG